MSQIYEAPTSKEQTSEITHKVVGHKENSQVVMVIMHKDSLVEEKVPLHHLMMMREGLLRDCVLVNGNKDWLLEEGTL